MTARAEYAMYHRLRDAAFVLLGNCCVRCGFCDRRALQFDHINGNGHQLHPRRNAQFFREVLREPEKFQLLCANCNWIKRDEQNEK